MFFQQLSQHRRPVRVAVIGAGNFGAGIVSHARYVPATNVCAVADPDLAAVRRAYRDAGVAEKNLVVCESAAQARKALAAGRRVMTQDASILFSQAIDVVAEATGNAEAGAHHAQQAIAAGKHVAMVTKEADVVVGPMLKRLADRAGVVYTAVEGDQHGMLTGFVNWAQTLGLEVLCGGKALDGELILDRRRRKIHYYDRTISLSARQLAAFEPTHDARAIARRAEALGGYAGAQPWDLTELAIAANSTGLVPDSPQLHCPPCRVAEIPDALCPTRWGGLLGGTGRIDAVQILREPHEASMGGGVFVVVRTRGVAMQRILAGKGIICHHDNQTALLMRPHHLLGVEAIGSILAAAVLHTPTGALEYHPRFDVIYRARRALKAGERIGNDHSSELSAEMIPAAALSPKRPLPSGLAQGRVLVRDVPAGTPITLEAVELPRDSHLLRLRRQQDRAFLAKP